MTVVRHSLPILAAALLAGCSFYLGEPKVAKTEFKAALSGAAQVPPTDSRASGYFEATYRPSTHVLEYRLNLVGLSGTPTMAWFQGPAGPGETAPHAAPINVPIWDYTIRDGVTLTREQAAQVLDGKWYVNVMTEKYPDGEIRGQILPVSSR